MILETQKQKYVYLIIKKLLKKKIFNTININKSNLNRNLKFIHLNKKIKKIVFSSVVPEVFNNIKRYIKKNLRLEVKELKQYNFNKILKIDVNKKQVGSDRLANAISVINNKDNFIILDFGTLQQLLMLFLKIDIKVELSPLV